MIIGFGGGRLLPIRPEVLMLIRVEIRCILFLLHLGQKVRLNLELGLPSLLVFRQSVMVHRGHVCNRVILEPT